MSNWTITWLGHAGFRIETAGRTVLLDPWLRGNPSFDAARFDEAISGAGHILLSHGHDDHAADAKEISEKTGAAVAASFELAEWIGTPGAVALNPGGAVDLGGGVSATFVRAVHSSSTIVDGKPLYLGAEGGWMIESGGETLYFMGDTDVFSDMALFQELHRPKYGIVPIGGCFTMDAKRAAFACKKFFAFEAVIPCHFGTFPALAQSADPFVAEMAPVRTIVPNVMAPIHL